MMGPAEDGQRRRKYRNIQPHAEIQHDMHGRFVRRCPPTIRLNMACLPPIHSQGAPILGGPRGALPPWPARRDKGPEGFRSRVMAG